MALSIVVDQKTFEEKFQQLLEKLELQKWRERNENTKDWARAEELHRKFIYEVHQFKNKLEK